MSEIVFEHEKKYRRDMAEIAMGSLALEGQHLSAEYLANQQLYINGIITHDELVQRVRDRIDRRSRNSN